MSDSPDPRDALAGLPARLAGADLEIVLPESLAERYDVALALVDPGTSARARAAALGLSWPRFRRRRAYTGNVLAYGGVVIDTLCAESLPAQERADYYEVLRIGLVCAEAILLALPRVGGAADFSAPPAPVGDTSGGA